jgi:hypothetical protein
MVWGNSFQRLFRESLPSRERGAATVSAGEKLGRSVPGADLPGPLVGAGASAIDRPGPQDRPFGDALRSFAHSCRNRGSCGHRGAVDAHFQQSARIFGMMDGVFAGLAHQALGHRAPFLPGAAEPR